VVTHAPSEPARPTAPATGPGRPYRADAVRMAAFAALAGWASLAWGSLVSPAAPGRVLGAVALALAGAPAIRAAARRRRRIVRPALVVAIAAVQVAAVLVVAGAPARLLAPAAWGELAAGIGQGIDALPAILVPYPGPDEWVRSVLLAGGGLLALAAGWLAFRPGLATSGRMPVGAAATVGALYCAAVVQHSPRLPFLAGAIFACLLATFLWAEHLKLRQAPQAALVTLAAIGAGMTMAPRLDARRPLLDYERLAEGLRPQGAITFAWTHRYGPLHWPRDGREVLRIRARTPAYWKAVSLELFDGVRWRVQSTPTPVEPDTKFAPGRAEWHQTIRVTVRRLQSSEYVGAGTTRDIVDSPRGVVRAAGGTFVTGGRPLGPGDGYRARVYTPRPTPAELRADTGAYPGFVYSQLVILLPPEVGGPPRAAGAGGAATAQVQFPAWGERSPARTIHPGEPYAVGDGAEVLGASRYARVYALARRLRRESSSPYDYVRRVQRRVRDGATYTETPLAHDVALDAFLFDDRRGYCQQFSGAMALLLRMGGIPARVASGFAPGAYERRLDQYLVRDLDAHSWVEAYFPRYGWVPFDPTPAVAPPRSQALAEGEAGALVGDRRDAGVGGRGSGAAPGVSAGDGRSGAWWPFALVAALAAAAALAGVQLRRRGRPPGPSADPELAELVRALHRTGRAAGPTTTLAGLERLLQGQGAEYVVALRELRYAGRGRGPAPADRRALRRGLGEGLGVIGRLRAWWALPPRLREWTALRRPYTGR
jgi:transglutaminase-like putative cysteine protease